MIDETVNYDSGIRNYNRMLEGKRAFITTAARGIGKSIAILFARQGATVYFAGRNECYVRETESELQLLAPESRGYICDLADGCLLYTSGRTGRRPKAHSVSRCIEMQIMARYAKRAMFWNR